MSDPFGRQRRPFKITIEGEAEDVAAAMRDIQRLFECLDDTSLIHSNILMVYPRAVND